MACLQPGHMNTRGNKTELMLHLWIVNKRGIDIYYNYICVATDQLGAAAFSLDVVCRSAQSC